MVNHKAGENFEVGNIWLPKCAEVRSVSPEILDVIDGLRVKTSQNNVSSGVGAAVLWELKWVKVVVRKRLSVARSGGESIRLGLSAPMASVIPALFSRYFALRRSLTRAGQ